MKRTIPNIAVILRSGLTLAALAACLPALTSKSQPITAPWGNLLGIQVDGEVMSFETALRMVNSDWSGFVQSSKYNWEGTPTFTRDGNTYTCKHFLEGTHLNYTTRVTDTGRGQAQVDLQVDLQNDPQMAGAYFCVTLPADDYAGA